MGGHHSPSEGRNLALGNMCLLLNTLAMALYYLTCALGLPADFVNLLLRQLTCVSIPHVVCLKLVRVYGWAA